MGGLRPMIGVLPGEGVGTDVVAAALQVLEAVQQASGSSVDIVVGDAQTSADVSAFCASVFAGGGAVLSGPYGGRVVYDLRRRFDLYYKLSPLKPTPALAGAGRLRGSKAGDIDVLVVREGSEGVYQGDWGESDLSGERVAHQSFQYRESTVRRLLQQAALIAQKRSGQLSVVVKKAGVPTISRVWSDVAGEIASETGVELSILDVDFAAYFLIQHPEQLDVLATPNLFGDILSDVGAVLLGSRANSFSGNFSDGGAAIFQTNHGAAHDLAGQDQANPAGQILALAMLLRSRLGMEREASMVEAALESAWAAGWRTFDLAEPGCHVVGTREFAQKVAAAVAPLF